MGIHRTQKEHPSYGMLGFHRTYGGETAVFGSSIKHGSTIRLTLKKGSVERDLNRDWYYGGETLFDVEMSQTQFAELITAMNVGDGVPVTIRSINGERMPPAPFEGKAEMHGWEFREHLRQTYSDVQDLISRVSGMFEAKKALTKKEREEVLRSLDSIAMNLKGNQEYQMAQFQEQMEKTVSEAKGEVEAFVSSKLTQLGQQKLVEEYSSGLGAPVALPGLDEE